MRSFSAAARQSSFATILLVSVLLVAGFLPRVPVAAPTTISPTPTIQTPPSQSQNPKIGMHTRLTDEPDPEKIRREFRLLREMGGSWATEFFPWPYIQPADRNRFDWEHADLVVEAAKAEGITLVARLDAVPGWARPPDSTWKYLDREQYADYGDFVYAFVSRYKGLMSHYIIWNEPNIAAEWGQRPPDPAAYTDLLKVAYGRAKEADPNSVVLMAGLAPTLEREGSKVALNDLVYLQKMYDTGAAPYFDAVAAHTYGLTASPDDPPASDKLNFARVEELYKVMQSKGDGAKPVFITEGGWNDSPRWSFAVKPFQRVDYTIDAYRKAADEWPWVKAVMLWAFRYPRPAYTYFDNYTFLTPDFTPKAIYLDVQKYATGK